MGFFLSKWLALALFFPLLLAVALLGVWGFARLLGLSGITTDSLLFAGRVFLLLLPMGVFYAAAVSTCSSLARTPFAAMTLGTTLYFAFSLPTLMLWFEDGPGWRLAARFSPNGYESAVFLAGLNPQVQSVGYFCVATAATLTLGLLVFWRQDQ